MSDLVTIRRLGDPVEAEMLVDLLEQEGIPASVPGNEHNAMTGRLLAPALNVPLMVHAEDEERARAILDALEDYDEVDPHDAPPSAPDLSSKEGGGPYRGGTTEETGPAPRKKIVAIAAALVLPGVLGAFGSGHFYARSYGRGFALLAMAWTCLILAFNGRTLAVVGIPLVVALDILGAIAIIDRQSG